MHFKTEAVSKRSRSVLIYWTSGIYTSWYYFSYLNLTLIFTCRFNFLSF